MAAATASPHEASSRGSGCFACRTLALYHALHPGKPAGDEENADGVSQDLRDVEGTTADLIAKLNAAGVHTRDDLADLATDELTDITGQPPEEATALIMTARAHWFLDAAVAEAEKPTAAQEQ